MPEYTYVCDDGHINIEFMRMSQKHPRRIQCKQCNRKAGRAYMPPQLNTGFAPYVTHAGDGKPKVIRNAGDERRMLDAFNLDIALDSDMKRMREDLPKQRERVASIAMSALPPIHEDYQIAEAEVKQRGTEFSKELDGKETKEAEAFQAIIDKGLVND